MDRRTPLRWTLPALIGAAAVMFAIGFIAAALVFSGHDSKPAAVACDADHPCSVGTPATLAPRALGVTGLHGPKGEPCLRVFVIPGKRDNTRPTSTTTVKLPKGTIVYTQTTFGVFHFAPGTKPAEVTERVCAYRPAP